MNADNELKATESVSSDWETTFFLDINDPKSENKAEECIEENEDVIEIKLISTRSF